LSSLSNIKPNIDDGWISGVIDARTSFTFDDFSPKIAIRSNDEFDKFIKFIFFSRPTSGQGARDEINFDKNNKIQGITIKPIMDYLNIYNPKLQSETFIWFNNYFKIWENYRNQLANLNPDLSEKGLANSKSSKNLFNIRNKILSELKLKRPKIKL
jgi:hypothetical protein